MSILKPKAKKIVEVNWQLSNADDITMDTICNMFDKKPEWILYGIRQKISALKDLEHKYNACVFSTQRPSKTGNVKTRNNMKVTTKMMDGRNSCNYERLLSKHFDAYNNCVTIGKSFKQIYLSPLNGYDDFITKLKNT